MNTRQIIFIILNIIGGILVIGSYIYGLKTQGNGNALWGGVPGNIKKVYTASIFISALTFFVFTLFILLKVYTSEYKVFGLSSQIAFSVMYFLVLIPSAFWMPLTYAMVQNPSNLVWIGVRAVLAIVALGALGILVSLLALSPKPTGAFYWSAIATIAYFFFHTGVLDALLWPYFWKK